MNKEIDFRLLKPENCKLSILCEGFSGSRHAKTATGVIKYGKWQVKSIIDSVNAGKSFPEFNNIPVVKDLKSALELSSIDALLIGIAPVGGKIPESWLEIIKAAIKNKIHIISGLHEFLNEIDELDKLAKEHAVMLWDLRNPDLYHSSALRTVAKQKSRDKNLKVITMVGSDCNVGKMCTALEIQKNLETNKYKASFLATGQTGIMISGSGVPLDRVIGDFMAGAIENEIEKISINESPEFILVEGQGSLLHPGYSGVTLSLLHGSNPDYLILCLKAGLEYIQGGYEVKIPRVGELINIYETASRWTQAQFSPAKIIGISVNTSELDESSALALINSIKAECSLPVTDPIRYGTENLCKALLERSKI